MLAATAMALSACGGDNGATTVEGHTLSAEETDILLTDVNDDFQIIMAATPETADTLAQALTGPALEQTKAGMDEDIAKGRYRKRDYQNLSVRPQEYNAPIAEMFVEFDDHGYYVDAKTGAQLTQPVVEHKAFALSVVEEDGRWKIRGIFEPSNETTPRQLPDQTGTQTVPSMAPGTSTAPTG